MEQPATDKLPLRLLLNAEPFGFGPSAAIAGFFPHLRPHFAKVGYVGKRHTLDLQQDLPYDALHDVSGMKKKDRAETLAPVFAQYDILLTAMDHKVAGLAKDAGLKVFYYDALAWYWPEIPEQAKKSDLYLAQDFFGVGERLKEVFNISATEAHIVPPICPDMPQHHEKSHILINLGGLQNPYWPVDSVVDYARTIIKTLRHSLPATEKIVIAGSRAVADQLQEEGVKTYTRKDMEDILAGAKIAIMTPGLGNIYDAAAFNIKTIWLPPANDSQGQQMKLLQQHGMNDATMDWPDITGVDVNYRAEQISVLSRIADALKKLSEDSASQERLAGLASAHYTALQGQADSQTVKLIDCFGRGGEAKVAELVIQKARQYPTRLWHG